MYSAKELAIARQIKPDIEVAQLDVTDLAVLQLVRKATGGGSGVYNATIENGIATFGGVVASQPLVSLKLNIPVTQTGSGTPSPDNVRDIVGVQGVQLFRGGSDLLENTSFENNTVLEMDGSTSEATGYITYDFIDVSNMNTIAIRSAKETTTGRYYRVCGYDSTKTFTNLFVSQIRRGGEFTDYFDVSGVDYIRVCWANNTTLFEAYNGNTYQITFGQTVYSGELDVLTGILTVTHKLATFDGSENWTKSPSHKGTYFLDNWVTTNSITNTTDHLQNIGTTVVTYAEMDQQTYACLFRASLSFKVDNDLYPTVEDFKNFLSQNNLQVLYPLATPIEVQLTPTEILTLIGENVIFADVANVTECKFTRK